MLWPWNRKKKKHRPGKNRIDAMADRLRQQGRSDELESELAKVDVARLDANEKKAWYHLRGLIPFERGDRALAFERFQEGSRQCPDSGYLRFALGQEHEFRGEIDEMLRCFDGARFPNVSGEHALAAARYAYLWDGYAKGWSYVEPLIPVYLELKVLDTNFLFLRGLPFFERTWTHLAAFSHLTGDFGRLHAITEQVVSVCTDCDFEYVRAELKAFESGDMTDLKPKIREAGEQRQAEGNADGYSLLRLGILLSQETQDATEAEQLLDRVALTEMDFPWLEDMRTLAKCELAHRVGDTARETDLQQQFLARQPMLFEPDHAVTFGLLQYQEHLKAAYQQTRHRER